MGTTRAERLAEGAPQAAGPEMSAKLRRSGPRSTSGSSRVWIAEADIDRHVFEPAPIEFRGDMIPYRGAFQERVESARPPDREREIVAELDQLRQTKIRGRHLFVVMATQVQIPGRAEVESYTKL